MAAASDVVVADVELLEFAVGAGVASGISPATAGNANRARNAETSIVFMVTSEKIDMVLIKAVCSYCTVFNVTFLWTFRGFGDHICQLNQDDFWLNQPKIINLTAFKVTLANTGLALKPAAPHIMKIVNL